MHQYFDLQVNGYGGVDLNTDQLSPDDLHSTCVRLEQDGVTGILATIVTERVEVMTARIKRLVELRSQDELASRMIVGLHIEGPFINENPGYRGAHPIDAIIPASIEVTQRLLEAGDGLVRLVTLAPERDPAALVTRYLKEREVRIAAGHTDASLDELKASCDAGLSIFTHVGNGCPMQMHRHDNIVQRALSLSSRLWLCFIADGVHVPFTALGNYLRASSIERCCIITDAIAPAGLGPGRFTVSRWIVDIGEDMVCRAPDGSHLIGAAITMRQSAENLRRQLGLSEANIRLLTEINPCRAVHQ